MHTQLHRLAAGYYPSILRVEHPAVRYTVVEGGTQEVEAQPSELRFFDKLKGVYVGICRSTSTSKYCWRMHLACAHVLTSFWQNTSRE